MSEARAFSTILPPAPERLAGDDGRPRFGLYAGSLADAAFAGLKHAPGTLQRRLMEKRWQYVFVATPEMMLAMAVVDCGYLSSGICAVFDRGSRRLLVDDNPVLPPLCAQVGEEPAEGMSARLLGPRIRARLQRSGGRVSIAARWAHAGIDLQLDANRAPPPVTAIAGLGAEGRFDVTQKSALVPAEGEVRAGNARFPVRGQLAGLDYSHGFFPRDTAWRWAFASGRAGSHLLALNLSEGLLEGEGENVLWIDGEPQATGPVRFTFDRETPLGAWRVQNARGDLDLVFRPEGHRSQDIDLRLIRSRYLQPFGTFSGHAGDVAVDGLPGVTEDHQARW